MDQLLMKETPRLNVPLIPLEFSFVSRRDRGTGSWVSSLTENYKFIITICIFLRDATIEFEEEPIVEEGLSAGSSSSSLKTRPCSTLPSSPLPFLEPKTNVAQVGKRRR